MNPSCRHTTRALSGPQNCSLLHTVPHMPSPHTSSLPAEPVTPPTRRMSPVSHSGTDKTEAIEPEHRWSLVLITDVSQFQEHKHEILAKAVNVMEVTSLQGTHQHNPLHELYQGSSSQCDSSLESNYKSPQSYRN